TASVAAVFLGIALVGCAAAEEEDDDLATPPVTETAQKKPEKKDDGAPKSEATISTDANANANNNPPRDPDDPAPPNDDQCIDKHDSGPNLSRATQLPPTDDCDDAMKPITGVMKGAVDVDYFKLSASDRG